MQEMTAEVVKGIIPDLFRLGVKEVHLTGGEPLLNPYIFEIIDILVLNNLEVRLQTNGVLIDPDIVANLKKRNLHSILISIDGLESSHNSFRSNKNSFLLANRAAELCVKHGLYTRINTVLHKNNVQDIEELLKLTVSIGVNQHSFFYLTPGGRGRNIKDFMLSLSEWNNAVSVIKNVAKQLNCSDKIKYQNLIVDLKCEINRCRIISRDNCLILSDGNVYPCVFLINSPYKLGNIYEQKLTDIWNNDDIWLQYQLPRSKQCKNENCEGGCKGLTYLLTGTMKVCDPRCRPKKDLVPGCIRRYSNLGNYIKD
jgi:radical SAM protein with 4Fe4S-binding SPASM domain